MIDKVTGKKLNARVEFENGMLLIHIEGYGELAAEDGQGHPVIIDYFDNKLNVFVWGDINCEAPTAKIDLAGAKESERSYQRWELDEEGRCIYCGEKCFEGEMCDEQQAGGFNEVIS